MNGAEVQQAKGNQIVKLNREWKSGDVVELVLPMHIFKNTV
ncbi:beta-L-arabinofuranosidase domain-containing protein [Mucilaginibacter humi]|nr:beta-L-arabinofuranosidase domain-containing protein [Mucilaginibacter humi]